MFIITRAGVAQLAKEHVSFSSSLHPFLLYFILLFFILLLFYLIIVI
jgi:hypothetical protein